ncbi:hypothetical protein KP509_22G055600 [Ceratopteris richardii]|uniref:Magnesium transporter n=2 Tax=Ceratopteris richardii TaxID=49495 RepID=A0A8T2S5E5_CERRI|nr:hypothetical protein KP509_22G055600 [Ceratopteris richardii]KAH7307361.1 hypothetical protein KP509_22G055600 [Ceratopteris richardii]KAH7307362.1 hypothetical protein KP509_22G055600 [Ceratopteris richardii]KAH7307364.1 hypothetical protein KP509_22G055600 [Ceratopteris richardii]KAH7307365.1 hypothetical protein KP509_22G055600 [Ceratopteris richardii]
MADMKTRLLPPRPPGQEPHRRVPMPVRPLFQGMDLLNLKKRGQGIRSWIKIDKDGVSQVMEVDKLTIMRRCGLPARDLRLLDPLFVYPSTILGREKAIVMNLEQIRCIITADEVLLLNSLDRYVLQYVAELQRRLAAKNGYPEQNINKKPTLDISTEILPTERRESNLTAFIEGSHRQTESYGSRESHADYMPFEFLAMEVALEAACTFLDTQATELEVEAYPVLDELTSKISTLNLERVRRLKSRLVALTRRVQKVRDEIEQLMDDDGDMAEMYLTEKQERMDNSFYRDQATAVFSGMGIGGSMSAPVSPVCSPPESRKLEKNLSMAATSRHSSSRVSEDESDIQELEMLLEAYFVVIDAILNKLTSLKEYIDDTEDFINIQLDNVRNQLIQFELILTVSTFVVAIFGVVAGVFGMNIPIELFDEPEAFKWVLIISGVVCLVIFGSFIWYFRRRGLMTL